MRELDSRTVCAMKYAVAAMGSQSELARRAGLTRQHISKYLNGTVSAVELDTWNRLMTVLQEYLPPEERLSIKQDFSAADAIPVVNSADALLYDPLIENFCAFAEKYRVGDAPVFGTPGRTAAIRISIPEEGGGVCPPGSLIFTDTRETPVNGHLCIGRRRRETVLSLRIFRRNNNSCGLYPLPGEKSVRSVLWTKPEDNPFLWLLPIRFVIMENRLLEEGRLIPSPGLPDVKHST